MSVRYKQYDADESIEIRVVVPDGLVQQEQIPVWHDNYQAAYAVEESECYSKGTCKYIKHMRALRIDLAITLCQASSDQRHSFSFD